MKRIQWYPKRLIGLVIVGLLGASMMMGCNEVRETKEDGRTPIVVNEVAHSLFYAPMYVAIEEGYFEKEGLDIQLVTGFGADKTMTALLTNEADIGLMGCESTIYTYVQGASDVVVNFAQLTQRAGNFLVAREHLENFSFKDLEGKSVLGGRKGGMPEMVFEYILEKQNVDKSKIDIDQSIDFGSTAAAFSGGQGDFTVEFEPYATMLEQKGDGYVVASLGEASGYVPYTSFSAKSSMLTEKPDVFVAFCKAMQKGMEYVNNNEARLTAEVIQKQFPETDLDTICAIVERYKEQQTWKKDLIFDENSFALLQNILMDAGELESMVDYTKLVNTDYAKQVIGN